MRMVSDEAIREVGEQLARKYRPERIVLFGSYAYGSPREDKAEAALRGLNRSIRQQARLSLGLDLLSVSE